MNKKLIVLSGGLDSSVLLATEVHAGHEVKAITVDYGQRHRREIMAAQAVCAFYGVEHRVADLSNLAQFMGGSSQTDPTVPVPHGHYAEENMKKTVVPNRNMLLLAVSGAWAISMKYDAICYAAHAGDHAIYPDCRESFVVALATALAEADWHRVAVERPFIGRSKADIVRIGAEFNVPFHLTYSCYEGLPLHCGLCGTCTERRVAFRDSHVTDPTQYDERGLRELPTEALES